MAHLTLPGNQSRINYPSYYSDDFASDTYAALTKYEYQDYRDRFKPNEQRLMSLADSEELLDQQLAKISSSSTARFSQAKKNSAMMNQRYGVQSNERQDNYNNTQLDAQKGLAISQAKNMSRLASKDRQMGILSGSSSSRQYLNESGE